MEKICYRLLISGRVQGVYYRAACRSEALQRGLSGWVRNLPDGRVEVLVEGPADAVTELIAWCHDGPALAHVTGVETILEDPAGAEGFRILP